MLHSMAKILFSLIFQNHISKKGDWYLNWFFFTFWTYFSFKLSLNSNPFELWNVTTIDRGGVKNCSKWVCQKIFIHGLSIHPSMEDFLFLGLFVQKWTISRPSLLREIIIAELECQKRGYIHLTNCSRAL